MAILFARLQSPFRKRSGKFSPLKAATLALLFVPLLAMIRDWLSGAAGPIPIIYFTFWTGVWAAMVLLASLAITPARRILALPRLIIIRRMIGVAGLLYTGLHVLTYPMLYRFDWPVILADLSRASIVFASLATLGFLALGLTSFDAMVRTLGARAWNQLHLLIHPSMALASIHFLLSPGSTSGLPFLMSGIFFYLMLWRLLERFWGKGEKPRALLVLALVSAALSLGFETAWLSLYQNIPADETLANTFSLQLDPDLIESGIAPTWQILILGLLVAALGKARGVAFGGRD